MHANSNAGRQNIENHLRQQIYVKKFTDQYPNSTAGTPISASAPSGRYSSDSSSGNIYAPFQNRLNWEIARWAKLHGPGSTALSELLGIEGVSVKSFSILHSNSW